jgi:hypothetical protein
MVDIQPQNKRRRIGNACLRCAFGKGNNANAAVAGVNSPLKCAVERRGTPVGESVKPTRQLSLQPVAAKASVEVMKHSKPLV